MVRFQEHETRAHVLVLESSPHMAKIVVELLRSFGFRDVRRVGKAADAWMAINSQMPNLIIGEAAIAPHGGERLCYAVRRASDSPDRRVPVILMLAEATLPTVIAARDAGADSVVVKPLSAENLATKIAAALRSPLPYIETASYTGPDRRRRIAPFRGPDRRRGERSSPRYSDPANHLLDIRGEAKDEAAPAVVVREENQKPRAPVPKVSAAVAVSRLLPGMELAENLHHEDGRLIGRSGAVLTADTIQFIMQASRTGSVPRAIGIRL